MGVCLLPLPHQEVFLYWRGWQAGQNGEWWVGQFLLLNYSIFVQSGQATSYVSKGEEPEEMPETLLEQHQSKLAKKSKKELKKEAETKAMEEEEGREERIRKVTSLVFGSPPSCKLLVLQAMREQDEREKVVDTLMTIEERKRPYNSLKADNTKQPTEEEMDAFMRKRKRADDPMNNFVDDV